MINIRTIIALLLLGVLFESCVPQRKFQEIADKQAACEEENRELKARAEANETRIKEFDAEITVAQRKVKALEADTAVLGTSLRILRNQYDKLNSLNNELLNKTQSLRAGTEEEKRNLMAELEQVRISLQNKEDALNEMEVALNEKETELLEREERLNELRASIAAKDSLMNALKNSVSKALLGFEGKGLTVEQRDGRVYVSVEANLLFATGSTVIDQNGKKALIDLARAIQDNKDLRIMVEGHTDSDEFSSNKFPKNNWDLSVLRATSVIEIMLDNSDVDPTALIAAGRSQYHPVDPDNKAKNRRIEVILSPKLDELMQLISE